jgi:murein peptide amidase A
VLRALIALGMAILATPGGQAQAHAPRHGPIRHVLGESAGGRTIVANEVGDPHAARKLLVVGCIHGTECAGLAIAEHLLRLRVPRGLDLWILPDLNPDGYASGHRQNGHGVDLNRNFPSQWRAMGHPWDLEYPGPRPASEPETRIAMRLILRLRPRATIWYHQHQDLVRAWGPSIRVARTYARLVDLPFRRLPWPAGTATNWQNHRLRGTSAFVVELPAGQPSDTETDRFARAVLRLGK